MPQAVLSASRVSATAGRTIGPQEWAELLFSSKAEFKELRGADELVVEATPDRLDLLCDAGLGLHLAGALGHAHGALTYRTGPAPRTGSIEVHEAVAPQRPEIAAVELTPPDGGRLTEGLRAEAIRFQELLHATQGLDRRLASFGLYAVDRFRGPLAYTRRAAEQVEFVPLGEATRTRASEFLRDHPMAARYGGLGTDATGILVLEDAEGHVLSLPPILNAEGPGSVRAGDTSILLESTGTRAARIADGLGLLMLPFLSEGWSAHAVPIRRAGTVDDGRRLLAARTLELSARRLDGIAGLSLPAGEVRSALAQARLAASEAPGGWAVEVPPWRPDLLAEVDLIEEVLLARGVRPEEGSILPSPTRGRRRPESRFREHVGDLLLGAGYVPLHTPVLIGRDRSDRVGRTSALKLTNPVSEELSVLRDRLLPSLLHSLARNLRHGYPQQLSEIGPTIVPDPAYETGGRTRWAAGFVRAGEGAGFADVAARADALLRDFGALGVREPLGIPGLIPGRGAVLRVAGEAIAELGELSPELLESEGIPVPVAYAELDLSSLWLLVRRSETD